MNWNKIKEYQKILEEIEIFANKHLSEQNVALRKELTQDLKTIRFDMFESDFNKELQHNFTSFIMQYPKICRQDIGFEEFDLYLKEWARINPHIKGFDINDQSHLEYLLKLVNERFNEIPFEFSPTHIKKYLSLSKFQNSVKKSCG